MAEMWVDKYGRDEVSDGNCQLEAIRDDRNMFVSCENFVVEMRA
jgi:hypothetical protein